MEAMMQRRALVLFMSIVMGFSFFVNGLKPSSDHHFSMNGNYHEQIQQMQAFKSSLIRRELASAAPSPAPPPIYYPPAPAPPPTLYAPVPSPFQDVDIPARPRVITVTSFGADPTGTYDSTAAIIRAIGSAFMDPGDNFLMTGILNLGGVQINLEGGTYLISLPIRPIAVGAGNFMITGGTLRASDDFPSDGYLIDLSGVSNNYNYEFVTLKDLMLDCNFRSGGISVINSLRTSIDNCYIAHFSTNGILVRQGHETYIRNSFIGQHITAGGDQRERHFSGTGINLNGNDNAITDVVIFSAGTGVMVSGQGNTLSGVHCYNKATGFGGAGIYLKLPNLTQTRIVNCYLDYNGIVAEDPSQLTITNSFFLGDGYVLLKSVNGIARGVNIVDNMFSGSGKDIDIVRLDESNGRFRDIDQVVVDRNNARGMKLKATVARNSVRGEGNSWTVDFNPILLFPNRIDHVSYSMLTENATSFPVYALRNISDNRVVIDTGSEESDDDSDDNLYATAFVTVHQGL